MDQIDLALLRLLEDEGRLSFSELAEAAQMSKTPVWKRVKALEEAGVIRGTHARLDPAALGFTLEAVIEVTLDFTAAEDFEAAVNRHPAVWRCHATTGDFDYLLHILARDMGQMDELIRHEVARMPGVRRTRTSVVTRAIKRDASLAHLARVR